jgi:hypothetical protein
MWTSSHAAPVTDSSKVRSSQAIALSAGVLGLSLLVFPASSAAAPCSGVPSPVFLSGSPAAEPLVQAVAYALQRQDPKPLTVVWKLDSSCGGVESVALDSLPGSCAPGACVTGKAKFWTLDTRDTTPKTCDLDVAGSHVDLALSDVFPATCPAFTGSPPAGILDTLGPVTAYGMVMAKQGSELAIHAEESHFVFGAGKAAGVKPWLNDTTIFLLGDKDAGQLLLGPRIKLGVGKWQGKLVATADDILSGLQNDPATAIGILPTPLADPHRTDLRILAFQSMGQHGAFYPDRRGTSFEKQNVRDGHYPLWGYLHMILRADPVQPTQPKSVNGARVADILLARSQVAGQDVLPMQVAAGLVPQCAMKVTRSSSDTAPLTVYAPPDPCHCWFEKNVTNGVLGCAACPDGNTCAIGKCRRSFCEVQ